MRVVMTQSLILFEGGRLIGRDGWASAWGWIGRRMGWDRTVLATCGKVCTPLCKILAPFQRSSRPDVEKNYRVEFAHRQRWGRVLWPAALSPRGDEPTNLPVISG